MHFLKHLGMLQKVHAHMGVFFADRQVSYPCIFKRHSIEANSWRKEEEKDLMSSAPTLMGYLGAVVGIAGPFNRPRDIHKSFGRKASWTKSGAYRVSPEAGETLSYWQRLLQCQVLLEWLPVFLKKLCLIWLAPSQFSGSLQRCVLQ